MRIALLLSGQPRFVKDVAPIILANVIGEYNVDTFCHFWFDDDLQSNHTSMVSVTKASGINRESVQMQLMKQ